MKLKKILCMILCLTMIAGMLAGCGSTEGSGETEIQESPANPEAKAAIDKILPDSQFYFLSETEELAPYYAEAEARKEAILNSSTEIVKSDTFIRGETYTGTAYYVSPNGNDDNDGRSPETAWRSPIKTCWGDVKPGDAVFFERGAIFRLDDYEGYEINLIDDVTYSAYGVGEKPVFTVAKENSAREECWKLFYEGPAGEKIWKYYRDLGDVGGITFDDSISAKRVWEVPTKEGWQATEVLHFDPVNGDYWEGDPSALSWWKTLDEFRTVEENLTEDMTYISRIDISNLDYPFDFASEYREGSLYLRCDDGNPGALFSDIEIAAVFSDTRMAVTHVFNGYHTNGYVLDNLSVKYYLDNAVFSDLAYGRDAVIQNCTVEWGGNRLHGVASPTEWGSIGDGIYGVCNNATIRNNYLFQSNNGFTFESAPGVLTPDDLGTCLAEGNLIEECWQGLRTYFHDENDWLKMKKLILRDNIILNSGENFDFDNPETPTAIHLLTGLTAKEIEIAGNVMIGSRYSMIATPNDLMAGNVNVTIHNNVFAQDEAKPLICEGRWVNGQNVWHDMKDAK